MDHTEQIQNIIARHAPHKLRTGCFVQFEWDNTVIPLVVGDGVVGEWHLRNHKYQSNGSWLVDYIYFRALKTWCIISESSTGRSELRGSRSSDYHTTMKRVHDLNAIVLGPHSPVAPFTIQETFA